MIETGTRTANQIAVEYPQLTDWLLAHTTAQLLEDKRLLSAEEKIVLQGGSLEVGQKIQNGEMDTTKSAILSACRQEPMIGYEIIRFAYLIGQELSVPTLYYNIPELLTEGSLSEQKDLVYILKQGDGNYRVSSGRKGYLTTQEGIVQLVGSNQRLTMKQAPLNKAPKPI